MSRRPSRSPWTVPGRTRCRRFHRLLVPSVNERPVGVEVTQRDRLPASRGDVVVGRHPVNVHWFGLKVIRRLTVDADLALGGEHSDLRLSGCAAGHSVITKPPMKLNGPSKVGLPSGLHGGCGRRHGWWRWLAAGAQEHGSLPVLEEVLVFRPGGCRQVTCLVRRPRRRSEGWSRSATSMGASVDSSRANPRCRR